MSYFVNIFEPGIHKMSDIVSIKSCENFGMLKKKILQRKIMIWIVLFLKQEALIRKILAKPFKVPLPNYQGKS